ARLHPEERAYGSVAADSNACARVSKDEDGRGARALMLRDASQRGSGVEAPVLAARCDAPQHEGRGGRCILAERNPRTAIRSPPRKRGPRIAAGGYGPALAALGRDDDGLARAKNQPAGVGNERRGGRPVSGLVLYRELRNSSVGAVKCRRLTSFLRPAVASAAACTP